MDFIKHWSERGFTKLWFTTHFGIGKSKYYSWEKRYGKDNAHNGKIPRDFWIHEWEKEAIVKFYSKNREEGYRRVCYMMMDQDIVAVSPATTYRVLKNSGMLRKWNEKKTRTKGKGFIQPLKPHEHWHVDISYINISGTFYYFIGVLDGYSRYMVHWNIRESMTEQDVSLVILKAKELFPDASPRIISDNGPQFIAKDFKHFVRTHGMTHVRTSPYYPQANGKFERFNKTLKSECIRKFTPLSLQEARKITEDFVYRYNNIRLHSTIGYISPVDKLNGKEKDIFKARDQKIHAARAKRKLQRDTLCSQNLNNYSSGTNYQIA